MIQDLLIIGYLGFLQPHLTCDDCLDTPRDVFAGLLLCFVYLFQFLDSFQFFGIRQRIIFHIVQNQTFSCVYIAHRQDLTGDIFIGHISMFDIPQDRRISAFPSDQFYFVSVIFYLSYQKVIFQTVLPDIFGQFIDPSQFTIPLRSLYLRVMDIHDVIVKAQFLSCRALHELSEDAFFRHIISPPVFLS